MKRNLPIIVAILASHLSVLVHSTFAQGSTFTYQGWLNSSGTASSGNYDFSFTLFDSPTGGASVGGLVQLAAVPVSNGLFTVTINTNNEFGATAFDGAARWLEISVRTNCGCLLSFTTLTPRQPLTATPYALRALNLTTNGLAAGSYGNAVTFNNAANSFAGTYTGNGNGLANVNAASLGGLASSNFWKLAGNSGANPTNGSFLGTTDNLPLELKVNGLRALRLEPIANDANHSNIVNVIGGSPANFVKAGVYGATISGGGAKNDFGFSLINSVTANYGTIGGGGLNSVAANYGFIGSGFFNNIESNADYSVIIGGSVNRIRTNSNYSAIAGGQNNTIQTDSDNSFIGGGSANSIQTSNGFSVIVGGSNNKIVKQISFAAGSITYAAIGGGINNTIQNSKYSIIGGGGGNAIVPSLGGFGDTSDYNTISGGQANTNTAFDSTIGGGSKNTITDSAAATIGGGQLNTCTRDNTTIAGGVFNSASGESATVPGGKNNTAAGDYSFAAGFRAKANHNGSFVWADDSNLDFASTSTDQFLIRAAGGVGIGLNNPTSPLHIASAGSTPQVQITQTTGGNFTRLRMNVTGSPSWEMDVSSGATPSISWWNVSQRMVLDYSGNLTISGTYSPSSDRNAKENFAPVDPQTVLAKVAALPITRWKFKQDALAQHIGPMAQDFYAAFNVGMDDKHIATVDADGVALVAIQGLNEKVEIRSQKSEVRIQSLEAENSELKQRLEKLERLMNQNN